MYKNCVIFIQKKKVFYDVHSTLEELTIGMFWISNLFISSFFSTHINTSTTIINLRYT